MSRRAASTSRTAAASTCRSTTTEPKSVLLALVDLIVLLSLVVQFAIAGYFLYLVYWAFELPPSDPPSLALPEELPHVLVQVPVYNEPLVVERVLTAAGNLEWPSER